jgi:cell division protein FtsL
MNTATRVMQNRNFVFRQAEKIELSRQGLGVLFLITLLFVSALAVVYLKDLNRRLFIQYQTLQQDSEQSRMQWGKLLLEQSALSTQARIQEVAQSKLGMMYPNPSEIAMVD